VLSEEGSERKVKVLIAEDNPAVRRMIEKGLASRGYEVVAAPDGEKALELAREWRPDAVVLDWVMPGMTGIQVCSVLKSDPETAEIPVIMLTGKTSGLEIEIGFEHGADEYLTKPFDVGELELSLRRFVRREGG
jgi:DNA-binding response OmpR family regulator